MPLRAGGSFTELRESAVAAGIGPILEGIELDDVYGHVDDGACRWALLQIQRTCGRTDLDALLTMGDVELTARHFRGAKKRLIAIGAKYLERILSKEKPAPPPKAATRAHLDAWAKENGVAEWLDQRLFDLKVPSDVATLLYRVDPRMTVRTLLETRTGKADQKAVAHVWHFLEERAAHRRRVLEEEARHAYDTRPLPPEPTLAALVERLRVMRRQIRATVTPRLRASVKIEELAVSKSTPMACTVVERAPFYYAAPGSLSTHIPLEGDGLAPKCRKCNEPCEHALAAIDELFSVIFDGKAPDIRSFLADRLGRPAWGRFLMHIDDRLAPSASRAPALTEARLWWWIDWSSRQLSPALQRPGKKGLLKPKRASFRDLSSELYGHPKDADLAAMTSFTSGRLVYDPGAQEILARALWALVGHPRVLVGGEPGKVEAAELEIAAVDTEAGVRLAPSIGGAPLTAEELHTILEHGRVGTSTVVQRVPPNTIRVAHLTRDMLQLAGALGASSPPIPPEGHGAMIDTLRRMSAVVPVQFPPSALENRVAPRIAPVVVIEPAGDGLEILIRSQPLETGALYVPGAGPRVAVGSSPSRDLVSAERDLSAEAAAAEEILGRLGVAEHDDHRFVIGGVEAALEALEILRAAAVECRWPKGEWTWKSAGLGQLSVRVEESRDWFGIRGGLDVDGHRIHLAVLLDAARNRKRYVRIGQSEFLRLEDGLRSRLEQIEPLTFSGKDTVEISPAAIAYFEDLAIEAPVSWHELKKRIDEARAIEPEVPASLTATLRPYQIEGHAWMTRLAAWGAGCVLADDMGLGKTVQALAVLLDRKDQGPQLVVAPTSVCFNWIREMERFAPSLRAIAYAGKDRAGTLADLGPGDVVITSYALLQRDLEALTQHEYGTLVIDEAQAIKNPATKRSRSVRDVRAKWVLALTGTPVENRLTDLWAIFRVAFPRLLGSMEHFRGRFILPIERDGSPEARAALSRVVRPFILRRTKAQVATELPARTEVIVDVVLSHQEREIYEDARLASIAHLAKIQTELPNEQIRFHVLSALTRLRRICCHPRLDDEDSTVPSAKLERFLRMTKDLIEGGHRALVFSQFTTNLALVRTALDDEGIAYLYLDGHTPAADRGPLVDRFQAGEAPLFLLSLKAGGTGLNLTAADTVIHLDPWWNPAVEDQAADRAHRLGQTQPVTIYRLVARKTIEEQILTLHDKKRGLLQDLLEGTDRAGALSSDELIALMEEGFAGPSFEREAPAETEEPPAPPVPAADPLPDAVPAGDASDRFEAMIELEVRSGDLAASTAAMYRRVGRRAIEIVRSQPAPTSGAIEAAYDRAIAKGLFPKSDRPLVRAVARRLASILDPR
jgi:superfamily II DNA or RNA helicase